MIAGRHDGPRRTVATGLWPVAVTQNDAAASAQGLDFPIVGWS